MSSPQATTPSSEAKPKALTKIKRRLSRIIGRENEKKAAQTGAPNAGQTVPTVTEEPPQVSAPIGVVSTGPSPPPILASTPTKALPTRSKPIIDAQQYAKIQEEKVRALFAKYNVTLEVGEWTPAFRADRPHVEKKIRMRIRRTCHKCQSQLGADRVCRNCKHNACKKCPRYPPRKSETGSKPSHSAGAAGKTDGATTKRPATQRSRMMCHECMAPFKRGSKECANCKHERCSQCQRSPLKSEAIGGQGSTGAPKVAKSPSFIKWTCEKCENVHRDTEISCLKCGREKTDTCKRERVSRGTSVPIGKGTPLTEQVASAATTSGEAELAKDL